MIASQFGKYKYIHQVCNKQRHFIYRARDSIAIFKKYIALLVNSKQLIINEIFRIDVIVGGDHSQCTFRLLMKLLIVTKSEKF